MPLPRGFFLYIFFSILSFTFLISNIKLPNNFFRVWRNYILYAIAPTIYSADILIQDNLNVYKNIMELINAREENIILRAKIIEYENQLMGIEEILKENEFLKTASNVSYEKGYKYVMAYVVLRDPNSWNFSVIINKGIKDGIKKNSAVVVLEGKKRILVGKVIDLSNNSSSVMLLTNPLFSVPVEIPLSKCDGLAEVRDLRYLVLNFPLSKSAPIGADVVVSAMSNIFPSGIHVGTVIENRGEIIIQPAFLKYQLKRVMVLVSVNSRQ